MKWQHHTLRYTSADEYIETAVEQLPENLAECEELITALNYLRDVIDEMDQRVYGDELVMMQRENWEEGLDTAIEVMEVALYEYRLFDREAILDNILDTLERKKKEGNQWEQ